MLINQVTLTSKCALYRLTLDPEDILAWGSYSQDDVLSHACLSAKWENNDAIDRAVTRALGGDPKVGPPSRSRKLITVDSAALYLLFATQQPCNCQQAHLLVNQKLTFEA